MNVRVLKPCCIEIGGTKHNANPGEIFSLEDFKGERIITAGYAEPTNAPDEIGALMQEFGDRSPGGDCWDWIKKHHAELLCRHFKAFRHGDLNTAMETYNNMLSIWERRHDQQQPELLAA